MGIPHLATLLEPYGTNIFLGCHHEAEKHRRDKPPAESKQSLHASSSGLPKLLVIDGPAMVHFVYGRLLALSDQALPSYGRLSEAVVTFLLGLQQCGLEIAAIYFDGALPESKRPTRVARLEASASRLGKIKVTYPHGFSSTTRTNPSGATSSNDFRSLLKSSNPIPAGLSSWPIPPFIIPACLDHLEKTQFASIVEVVPGEADSFCATRAFQYGGVVLSGDSDLLVHALGQQGAYIPLNSLQFGLCSDCSHHDEPPLGGRGYRRSEIEQSLGVQDLVRVAFEISEDPHATLGMAVQRARQGMLDSEAKRFASFRSLYENLPLQCDVHPPSATDPLKSLDPRVAEFVWQLENTTTRPTEVHVYLPLLFEDQTRASAWAIGSDVRDLAYNAAIASCRPEKEGITVIEMLRSGPKRIARRSIDICRMDQLDSGARRWAGRLDAVPDAVNIGHSDLSFWRIVALKEVCAWYVGSGRTPPSADHLKTLLTNHGRTGLGMGSWYDIHLAAQFQAVVYSFRMLQQVLRRCEPSSDGLVGLRDRVHGLPPLVDMLEGQSKLSDVDGVIKVVLRMHLEENGSGASKDAPQPKGIDGDVKTSPPIETRQFTKREEGLRARKPGHQQSEKEACSENMYSVLANRDA